MWTGLSNEKMIGILHAFVLLKPSLFKSMNNCEQTEDAILLMKEKGFKIKNLMNCNDNPFFNKDLEEEDLNLVRHSKKQSKLFKYVPIVTRFDAENFSNMEFAVNEISDNYLLKVFEKLQKGLEMLG